MQPGGGGRIRLLAASSLSAIKDVDTQEVTSALEELQRGLQANITQQCLLSVFSFAETVFQPPSCPWPQAPQQYDLLSKGMVKILGMTIETLSQGDPQLALLACERLMRLDRVTSAAAILLLVWKGVVQLATSHREALAHSFQAEEVVASLMSYVEDGEVKIKGVVGSLKRPRSPPASTGAPADRASGGDAGGEYNKASRVLTFYLLRLALIVRAFGRRLSSPTLERVCRVLCLLRGRLDGSHIAWTVAPPSSELDGAPCPAAAVRELAEQGLVPKVEQTFLKALAEDETGASHAKEPQNGEGFPRRLVAALGAVCTMAAKRPSSSGSGGARPASPSAAGEEEDERDEALHLGAARLLVQALRASATLPRAAQEELCHVVGLLVPRITGFLYPTLLMGPASHPAAAELLQSLTDAIAAHLLCAAPHAATAVQDLLLKHMLCSRHVLDREVWLCVWRGFLRGCAPPVRSKLLHLLTALTDASPVALEQRAFMASSLPHLATTLEAEDKAALIYAWVARVLDAGLWGREACLGSAWVDALRLCPRLLPAAASGEVMQRLADALLSSSLSSSSSTQAMAPRQRLGLLRLLAEWGDALSPVTPIPCRDRLPPLLLPCLRDASLGPHGPSNILHVAAVLIDLLDVPTLDSLLQATLLAAQAPDPRQQYKDQPWAECLIVLPHGLARLTHAMLDHARLRENAQVMGSLERLWSLLLGRSEWALRGAVLQSLRPTLEHSHMADTTLKTTLQQGLAAHTPALQGSSTQPSPSSTIRDEARALRRLAPHPLPCAPPRASTPPSLCGPQSSSSPSPIYTPSPPNSGGGAALPPPGSQTMDLHLGQRAFLLPLSDPSSANRQTYGVLLLSTDICESVSLQQARDLLLNGMRRPAEGNVYAVDVHGQEGVTLRVAKRPKVNR